MKKDIEKIANKYIDFIEKSIVDQQIKGKILDVIKYFRFFGQLVIIDGVLYGKTNGTKNHDYLEIRKTKDSIICNYTEWSNKKTINICQFYQKDKNIKINKLEKVEYECTDGQNETSVDEIEMIYDRNSKLIYMSELNKKQNNLYCNNQIKYSDTWYDNLFTLEKTWFINNNSIIKYKLSKKVMNKDSELQENHSICYEPIIGEFERFFIYNNLDEKLFKDFMTGNISIETLIEENKKLEETKELKKKLI